MCGCAVEHDDGLVGDEHAVGVGGAAGELCGVNLHGATRGGAGDDAAVGDGEVVEFAADYQAERLVTGPASPADRVHGYRTVACDVVFREGRMDGGVGAALGGVGPVGELAQDLADAP